ncbi:HNH endonuclease [Svornostia abyssi]|uniref:HNH endonuclease n=1 Tax=Svornostia abyssi TaxID=2898438 RepID=A0ABY5PMA8_9ACTN|nr:HNH endonuclease [Parviterribacteraceae bacterium J379]
MVWEDERAIREAVAASLTYSEALRRLELRAAGGNFKQLKRYIERYGISTAHFDPNQARRNATLKRGKVPLAEILVEGSRFRRSHLKERLYAEGLKARRCEGCGQGEEWRGARIALILDHVNGVADDNRIENLRILCPNCNATLPTHCGRNARLATRACAHCGGGFQPRTDRQRFCSLSCGWKSPNRKGPRPDLRRVERPPYDELVAMLAADGYEATGRRFGVSGNAVRKWRLNYERETGG